MQTQLANFIVFGKLSGQHGTSDEDFDPAKRLLQKVRCHSVTILLSENCLLLYLKTSGSRLFLKLQQKLFSSNPTFIYV